MNTVLFVLVACCSLYITARFLYTMTLGLCIDVSAGARTSNSRDRVSLTRVKVRLASCVRPPRQRIDCSIASISLRVAMPLSIQTNSVPYAEGSARSQDAVNDIELALRFPLPSSSSIVERSSGSASAAGQGLALKPVDRGFGAWSFVRELPNILSSHLKGHIPACGCIHCGNPCMGLPEYLRSISVCVP